MSGWVIRDGTGDDLDAVLALWARSDGVPPVTDSTESLRGLVRMDPQALLVADAHGELVGSLSGTAGEGVSIG